MDGKPVIAGVSGRYPESANIEEFWGKLIRGEELYTADDRRWPIGTMGLPHFNGKVPNIEKCDAEFFKFDPKETDLMDPQMRVLHEVAYEAIWDAGIDPDSLRGSKTGFFLGFCYDDTNVGQREDDTKPPDFIQFSASKLPYTFDWRGPSVMVDSACASSFSALTQGLRSMEAGECDQFLVAGVAIQLRPQIAFAFYSLSMLSTDGKSKCLDSSADGYCRSEAVVAIFVQRQGASKRIYARIVDCQTNCDGFKPEGITFPRYETQLDLMNRVYSKTGINTECIDYVEAHVTGTKAGDPVETRALLHALRKDSEKPLLVGCLKSNMGHSEGTSALAAISKVIKIFQTCQIPPNINFKDANPFIEGLVKGIIKPVLEVTPFDNDLIPVNSFGFGGVNVHAILQANGKRIDPQCDYVINEYDQPRLVVMCNRTTEGVGRMIQFINANLATLSRDTLALVNDLSKIKPDAGLIARGLALIDRGKVITTVNQPCDRRRSLWLLFSSIYGNFNHMSQGLMRLNFFKHNISTINSFTRKHFNIDTEKILTGTRKPIKFTENLVSLVALQTTLFDLIKHMDLEADGIVGHGFGEIAAGYADGCLTREEALKIAYVIGNYCSTVSTKSVTIRVYEEWEKIEQMINDEDDIGLVSMEAKTVVTLSGSSNSVKKLIGKLQESEVKYEEISIHGIRPHHNSPSDAGNIRNLRDKISEILGNESIDRSRSDKWLCTSAPAKMWDDKDCQMLTTEYIVRMVIETNNLANCFKYIPQNNCAMIEIGPDDSTLRAAESMIKPETLSHPMITVNEQIGCIDNSIMLAIGMFYLAGHNPSIEKLYPQVTYPVARETPCLSHLIEWDHSIDHNVCRFPQYFTPTQDLKYSIELINSTWKFLRGHFIDGRVLFPATGYLYVAWESVILKLGVAQRRDFALEFMDVKLHRATVMDPSKTHRFVCNLNLNSEEFSITEGGAICVTGRWRLPKVKFTSEQDQFKLAKRPDKENELILKRKDIYKELRVRGYDYGESFQGIVEAKADGSSAMIKYQNHWISFADSCLQIAVLSKKQRRLYLPTYMEYVYININETEEALEEHRKETGKREIEVRFDPVANIGVAPGLILKGLKASPVERRQKSQQARLEVSRFVPYDELLTMPVKLSTNLIEYEQLCIKCVEAIKYNTELSKDDAEQIKRTTSLGEEKHALLSLFEQALSLEEKEEKERDDNNNENDNNNSVDAEDEVKLSPLEKLRDLIEKNRKRLPRDMLLREPLYHSIQSQLQIITDNISGRTINVSEINFTYDIINEYLSTFLEFNGLRCTSMLVVPEENFQHVDAPGQKMVKFSTDPKRMGDLKSSDLFVFRDYRSSIMLGSETAVYDLKESLQTCYECIKDDGFLLLSFRNHLTNLEEVLMELLGISKPDFGDIKSINDHIQSSGFTVVAEKIIESEGWASILLRKTVDLETIEKEVSIIQVTENNFEWVDTLKNDLNEKSKTIWLAGEGLTNGIMGLTTCLRREPKGGMIKCYYCPSGLDRNSDGSIKIPADILRKNLTFNMVKEGILGCLASSPSDDIDEPMMKSKYVYANVKTKGDLSSFRWFRSAQDVWGEKQVANSHLQLEHIKVHYAALNFKDVMVASGRIPLDAYPEGYFTDCLIGMEYSGVTSDGKRVMGFTDCRAIATSLWADSRVGYYEVPSQWTLEEAATIPVAYFTAYYGLNIRGNLCNGESILIHAGSGAVGQAAVSICLAHGCEVFVTVGTQEKREFMKKRFPQLDDDHIANSRDTTFEEQVLRVTNGRGVDMVLNSLAEDKLKASVRCLAESGRYIEIGKYDIVQNNKLDGALLADNKTMHVVCLAHLQADCVFGDSRARELWHRIAQLMYNGITTGEVRPLSYHTFERDEIEKSFRFMASGKHIGKVLIKIQDEKTNVNSNEQLYPCIAQTYFNPERSYIITGGLGGLGLEIADWMLSKGAANLILTSRSGIKEPYQQMSIDRLNNSASFNPRIIISNEDCLSKESVHRLIDEAESIAPVGGIFLLAMVLKDALIENQTAETFEEVAGPKTRAAMLLDEVTRSRCHELEHFVCFSSVAAGKGNAGQSNYGFANSSLERICEKRRTDNLPGLAIQWGALGDVGFVAEVMGGNDLNIAGTVPQRLPSIFETMDKFVQSPYAVVSSIVLADTKRSAISGKESLLTTICHVLGVKDPSKLDPNSTLGDLGMDSLMTVEIKQGLEREYDLVLSTQEIRNLKIKDIPKIEERRKKSDNSTAFMSPADAAIAANIDFDPLEVPSEIFVQLNSGNGGRVFLFPPIEGSFKSMAPLLQHITRPVTGVNWSAPLDSYESVQTIGEFYVNQIREKYPEESQFDIIGYSFGGVLAMEVACQLQDKFGPQAVEKLILMDSSPELFQAQAGRLINQKGFTSEHEVHVEILVGVASCFLNIGDLDRLKEHLTLVNDKEKRYQVMADLINRQTDYVCDSKKVAAAAERYYHKMKLTYFYKTDNKFTGDMTLIRCSDPMENDVEEFEVPDYGLSKYITGKVLVQKINGTHQSFIKENAEQVGSYLDTTLTYLQFA